MWEKISQCDFCQNSIKTIVLHLGTQSEIQICAKKCLIYQLQCVILSSLITSLINHKCFYISVSVQDAPLFTLFTLDEWLMMPLQSLHHLPWIIIVNRIFKSFSTGQNVSVGNVDIYLEARSDPKVWSTVIRGRRPECWSRKKIWHGS